MKLNIDHPLVAVDALIFSIINGGLSVLLIKRSSPPFVDEYALPGCFVGSKESLEEAIARTMREKAKISDYYCEQLFTFGEVDRDPRGRVISVGYLALVAEAQSSKVGDGLHTVAWFPLDQLPQLAFDHQKIVTVGVARLKSKIGYSNIAVGLMPSKFGLGTLQKVYESILGRTLDKRNFRKKILSLNLLHQAGQSSGDSHRPAKLYSFETDKPVFFR